MSIQFRPRLLCVSALLLILTSSSIVLAQHDPSGVTGGGMIGGSTGRPAAKPATKPVTTKPAAITTAPRRRTTPTPVKRPTVISPATSSADTYYRQGEALYNTQKY